MSSGPVGLDVREYAYGYFSFNTFPNIGLYTFSARKNWLITKVQLFAGAVPTSLALSQSATITGPLIPVAANGCLILEPNGSFRGTVQVSAVGDGALLVIEYWFQAQSGQAAQNIPIDVSSPP